MTNLKELQQAMDVIESFAPLKPLVKANKPFRIGYRQVAVWVIPVTFITNEQLIEVRRV